MTALRRWTSALIIAAAVAVVAVAGTRAQVAGPAVAPPAPAGLTYQVSGSTVYLNWINSPTPLEFYRLEAGDQPGQTFFFWDSNQLHDPNTLPQKLARFATSGVGPGNYYVRIRGYNADGFGAPTPDIVVPVTGGCQVPGPPTELTAITRGSTVYLAWNAGNGGLPEAYTIHASYTPGGDVIAALPTTNAFVNVGGVPPATYYVRAYAHTACGTSAASNEIVVSAPGNSPALTPNGATGRLPWPYVRDLVFQAAAEAIQQGKMEGSVSCPLRPGYPADDIEARKTQRNPYIDHIVARLRQFDQRFGYNAKPTRSFAQIAGDEIAYHWGSDAPEGSPNVYLIDVLGGHCTFGNETPDYRTFSHEYGLWTSAGAF